MSNETQPDVNIEESIPTFVRPHGVAWKAEMETSTRVLSKWFLYLPKCSDSYNCFFFTLHHLRHIKGEKKQVKYFKQASHGILLLAIEPEQTVFINKLPKMFPTPLFTGQWYCATDDIAVKLVTETVDDMCRGSMNPVDNEKDGWVMRFGDNLADRENLRTSFVLQKEGIN